jgi:hypothetical protein
MPQRLTSLPVHLARRHVFRFERPKTRPRGRDILQITCRTFLPVKNSFAELRHLPV